MTSLWLQQAAPFDGGAGLPRRADVAVIGAGVAGVAAALHLAERGAAVVVLEQGVVAGRASGRNDGQLLLGLGEHYNRIVGQFGCDKARALWDFIARNHDRTRAALAAHGVECHLHRDGGLRLAETGHEASELDEAAALLAAEGIAHERLDAAGVARIFPAARGFFGALLLPGEAVVEPVSMVRGLARAAVDAAAVVVERAPVARIDGGAGAFTVVLDGGRELSCAAVVQCTSALGNALDPSGFLQRTVFPFRGQVIATDPLPPDVLAGFPRCAMSSNFCYEYFRVHGQRLVLGGMRWSVPGEEQGTVDDSQHNPAVSANLRDYAARHFAGGSALQWPHVWTGIMAGTPDGLPLVGGLPGRPGHFVLGAFNGYGLSFAFLAGALVADLVLDGRCDDPAAPLFAPRRFA